MRPHGGTPKVQIDLDEQGRRKATMGIVDGGFHNGVVAINLFVLDGDSAVKTGRLASDRSLVGGEDHHEIPSLDCDIEGSAGGRVGTQVLALRGELVIRQRETVFHVGVDCLQIDGFVVLTRNTKIKSVVAADTPDLPARRSFCGAVARSRSLTEARIAVLVH